jgi:N-acetylglucosamine-6-sulfatase
VLFSHTTLKAWIKSVVEQGPDHPPFFAYLGPHAPHLPSTPAPWYANHPIYNTPVPKAVYYNYSGVGKHAFGNLSSLAVQNRIIDAAGIADEHGRRLQTLLSVDDIVDALHGYLVSVNEWDTTYWLQTSDHGYSLGEFMIDSHKTQVWDHNTRV